VVLELISKPSPEKFPYDIVHPLMCPL
jgi:hypothetical protein